MKMDGFQLLPKHYGMLNKNKIIYYIELGNGEWGFFAVYRALLEALYFADIRGMLPVIRYRENFLYAEKNAINGTTNPFEYYFVQPSFIKVQDAKKSYKVVVSVPEHTEMVRLVFTGEFASYHANSLYLKQLARIQNKYIRLNENTSNFVKQGLQAIIGNNKVLGVHLRGTDFKKNYNIHPVYIKENEYIEAIKEAIKEDGWEKIFLATDDLAALDVCKHEFGDKLVYYEDVYRTQKAHSVAFSHDNRENHKYRLGLEVLRDAYTLAACDGLIAGISQVSISAQIIKLSQKKKYSYIKILDKGINENNRKFKK